jgi:hypothetical protein
MPGTGSRSTSTLRILATLSSTRKAWLCGGRVRERAFGYPKVRKYIHASLDPELWFEDVILLAQFVAGDYELEGVSEDADDDKYFAAAVEGRATLIVTGDPDLLTVKEHRDESSQSQGCTGSTSPDEESRPSLSKGRCGGVLPR